MLPRRRITRAISPRAAARTAAQSYQGNRAEAFATSEIPVRSWFSVQVPELGFLFSSGDYDRCLTEAEARLAAPVTSEEEAAVQQYISRCRSELGDSFGALEAAIRATEAAQRGDDLDLLATCLQDQGALQLKLRRYRDVQVSLNGFLSLRPVVSASVRSQEGQALLGLGQAHRRLRQTREATVYLEAARSVLERSGDGAGAELARGELVRALLEGGQAEGVPVLLEEGDLYAAAHPDDAAAALTTSLDWGEYFFQTGDYQASIDRGFLVLDGAPDLLAHQARAHLLLCRNALVLGRPKDALNFALGARVAAIDGRRYDLEFEASEVLFQVLRQHGTHLLAELDREYQQVGLDICQYISEEVYNRLVGSN